MLQWFWNHHIEYASAGTAGGAIATGIAVIVAIAAAFYARAQVNYAREQVALARALEQDRYAKDLYRDYLKVAFENPVLADPTEELSSFDYEKLTIGGSKEEFQRYEWFMSFVLDACQELFLLPTAAEWRATIRQQIKYHWVYLDSKRLKDAGYLSQCDERFRSFIESVVAEVRKDHANSRGSSHGEVLA